MTCAMRQKLRSGRDDNSFLSTVPLRQNCHPDRSVAQWRDLRVRSHGSYCWGVICLDPLIVLKFGFTSACVPDGNETFGDAST